MTNQPPRQVADAIAPVDVAIAPTRPVFGPGEPVTLLCTLTNPNPVRVDAGTAHTRRSWLSIDLADEAGRSVPEVPDERVMPEGMCHVLDMLPGTSSQSFVLPLGEWFAIAHPGRYRARIEYRLPYAALGSSGYKPFLRAMAVVVGTMRRMGDRVTAPDTGAFPFATGSCEVQFEVALEPGTGQGSIDGLGKRAE